MSVISSGFEINTRGEGDVLDITGNVAELVLASGLEKGTVTVFVPGSTAAVTTIEFEPGLVEDTDELFERIAPSEREYHHNKRWHDGNGHSHVRAALLGPSLVVPFSDGKLLLGVWQQIVLIEFDIRPRSRNIICQIIGE